MTNESSSMTMKSDNESKLVNTTSTSSSSSSSSTSTSTSTSSSGGNVNVNNNNIYNNCNIGSNKSVTVSVTTATSRTVSSIGEQTTSDLLPSITLAPFAKIKRESEFGEHTVRQSQSSSTPTSSSSSSSLSASASASSSMVTKPISSNSQVPTVGGGGVGVGVGAVASNSVSAKMGSRRIFTPQFKLQVLESYRNDSDCKGNQRATARKYNIHRRQIQKWLQCESNLRSSVANISANNVKHQFHNISHQMPIVTTSTLPSSASSSIHTSNNHHAHHNHQQYKAINNRLSLDTTRHSVALTSIPTIPTSKAAQGVLTAAAAAAAAANMGDVGAVVPLSSSSPASTSYLSTTVKSLHAPTSPILHPQILTKSTVSPSALQCAKGGPVVIGGSSIPPPQSMLHTPYHLHDSVGIHTPPALLTSVPVPVSIITPHPHTHLHVANLKSHYHHLHMESQQQQQHHHHHHHHHHHPYNQMAQPPPPPPPPPPSSSSSQQSSERRPFMPSASLPVLPTSSSSSSSSSSSTASSPPAPMPAVALSCTDTSATTPAVALSLAQAEENRIGELRDYQTTTALLEENRYMNENEYVQSRTQLHSAFEGFPYYMPLHMHPAAAAAAAAAMIAPIDLSLGTKRLGYALSFSENNNEFKRDRSADSTNTAYEAATPKRESSSPKEEEQEDDNEESHLNVVDSDFSESSSVVDLTLRKRKVIMPTATEPETVSAEKQTKLSPDEVDEKETEKPQEPAKTFKLFKPYLLDEDNKSTDGDKESASKICKQKEPIIWSHHTACLSPPMSHDSRQCSSRGSNFQSPPAADAAYPFPAGSPNFQPANATVTSASFRCPKGSPVSGYESSSSIYSDSASSTGGDHHYTNAPPATYSFDLKVHNIHGDLPAKHLISTATNRPFIGDGCIPLPPATINHVQRWLDQESGIRQSIALYV